MIRSRAIRYFLISLGILTAVVVLAGAGLYGYWWHVIRTAVDGSAAHQRAALERHRVAFLEDQRFAATLPIFARRAGRRDASSVLGPRVNWIVADQAALERYRQALAPSQRGLLLDPALEKQLEKDWLDADPRLWAGLDFAWMSHLEEFNFWDLDANGPEATGPTPVRPTPNTGELTSWAKLRLAKGLRERAPAAAVREVEELARLCATIEDHIGVAYGLSLLGLVDQARDRAASLDRSKLAIGRPLSREDRWRLFRAAYGARAYTDLRASSEHDADWNQTIIGRCSALRDGLDVAATARPLLGASYSDRYERLGRLLEGSPECRLTRARRAWLNSEHLPSAAAPLSKDGGWLGYLDRWGPAVLRRSAGEVLLSISEQDWFRQYDPASATPCTVPEGQVKTELAK